MLVHTVRIAVLAACLLAIVLVSDWASLSIFGCEPRHKPHPYYQADPEHCAPLYISLIKHIGRFWGWTGDFLERNDEVVVAVATAFIALFTLTLWWSTKRLGDFAEKQAADMKESLRISGIAAEAAKESAKAAMLAAGAADLSARAAIAVELPVIRATGPSLIILQKLAKPPYGGVIADGPPGKYSGVNSIEFGNDGRSNAFPVEMSVGWAAVERLPDTPEYKKSFQFRPGDIIKPGAKFHANNDFRIMLTDDEVAAVGSNTAHLWLYIKLTYIDFIDNRHEIGFCWRWAQIYGMGAYFFRLADSAPPQYTRKT